jgi:hypothetical protein
MSIFDVLSALLFGVLFAYPLRMIYCAAKAVFCRGKHE